MSNPTIPACPDCGEYPVNHISEYFSAWVDSILTPFGMAIERIVGRVKPFAMRHAPDQAALPLFRVFAALRLGKLKTVPDEYDSARNRWLFDAARRRGITLYHFRVLNKPDGSDFFVAQLAGRVVAFEGLPRPDRGHSASLEWMDNKAILKQKFMAAGIPVARGDACFTYAKAWRIMHEVSPPVIAKPHIGSRSRHSTVGIFTPEELRVGFEKAKRLSPWVIVEQQLQGYLFRVLLVRKKIAGIIRREQAHVVGDGATTVRDLVARENKNPRRAGPTFHQIPTDGTTVDWNFIPARGEVVNVNDHISRYYGGSTTDFTERAHPDNVALFEHIGHVLDDSLVGVDFIIDDMERSWRDQPLCGVIECNSLPNIDLHHDVLYGESRDVGGLLLDIAFKT